MFRPQPIRASILLLFLGVALSSFGHLRAQSDESLAILDLEGRGISAVEAASLTDRLRAALVRTRGVTVVERGQMERILGEQDFQLTGCTSDECAVEVGQLLGVTTMVAGSIGRVGSTYSVDIRTINVQSGQITHSLWRDYRGEIDGLLGIMPDIAGELVDAMGAMAAPEPPPPPPAALIINSTPPGASVTLNSEETGTTPLDTLEIEANRVHSLSLSLAGFHRLDTTIVAESGQVYAVALSLEPLPGRLTILTVPPGARIILDDADRGLTPLSESEVAGNRTHTASIRLAGYQPVDTSFFAGADQSHEVTFRLARLPSRLTVRSTPSGAAVFLDRQRLGQTPLTVPEVVPERQHALALRLNGYLPVDTTFFAQAGQHHQVTIAFRPVAVAEAPARPRETPPAIQPSVQPAKKGGGGFLTLIMLGAVGYYGYTQGWFDEWLPPPEEEELRVGNPPRVPTP